MQTFTLKVIATRVETDDTITLCFRQPTLKKVKYLAGQYLTLIFRINGRRYIRPYSFSSAPNVDRDLEVTIKRMPNGVVSNHIHDVVKAEDLIEVMPPMGDFLLPANRAFKSIFLWGAGSGITPLMSIAKFSLKHQVAMNVYLIYGNRNVETTIFEQSIKTLQDEYPEMFKLYNFHTQLTVEDQLPNIVQGRVDPVKAIDIIGHHAVQESAHFICGPVGLKQSVSQILLEKGVHETEIFFEDFELVKNPKDFEAIKTQNINLIFNGGGHKLEVAKGKSILEVALNADLELPYSCQTGNCSTCKATLKKGSLKMIGLKEERKDLAQNEFLLCCSYPCDEHVVVEI